MHRFLYIGLGIALLMTTGCESPDGTSIDEDFAMSDSFRLTRTEYRETMKSATAGDDEALKMVRLYHEVFLQDPTEAQKVEKQILKKRSK